MGSFNTTCAISNAPIREGDKVRLFFLVSESYRHTTEEAEQFSISKGCQCYPHDDFKVIGGVALEATYSDYNTYDFDYDSVPAKFILNTIKKEYAENVPKDGIDYNEYHDHMSVKVEDLDFDKVQDMMHSGRLFLNGYTQQKSFVQFMAVHESVFQVLKPNSLSLYNHDLKDYETKTIDEAIAETVASLNPNSAHSNRSKHIEMATQILQPALDEAKGNAEEYSKVQKKIEDFADMLAERDDRDDQSMRGGSRDYVYHGGNPAKDIINFAKKMKLEDEEDQTYQVTSEDVALVSKLAKETEYFNFGMVIGNFMYRPIMTSGQESDFPAHANLLREIANAIEIIPSPWAEESLTVNVHRESWQEINLSDIESRFKEWYGDDAKEVEEGIAVLKSAIEGLDVLIVTPEELHYRNDKYELHDMIENRSMELRIYNK